MGHTPKFVSIGNLGNDLLFVTIGNLGHALDFVTIGNLGNDKTIAKIANDFGRGNKRGGRWRRKAPIIGNIGKIVTPKKLAKPHTDSSLQYKINDKIANSPVIVLQINDLALAIVGNPPPISWAIHAFKLANLDFCKTMLYTEGSQTHLRG